MCDTVVVAAVVAQGVLQMHRVWHGADDEELQGIQQAALLQRVSFYIHSFFYYFLSRQKSVPHF